MIEKNKRENTIEKFTGRLEKEDSGFTMLLNDVLQNIIDIGSLGLYCYLSSKPQNWSINVKEIASHFKIGRDKSYKLLNNLIEIGALSVKTIREEGKFVETVYFLHIRLMQPMLSPRPENTEMVEIVEKHSPLPEKPDPVNQHTYKTKRNTKQRSPIVPKGDACFSFIDIWNEYALRLKLTPLNKNNSREVKYIASRINDISIYWPELNETELYNLADSIKFTAGSFEHFLKEGIRLKWHMLCGDNPHSMNIILRRTNFAKGVLYIKKQQKDHN